MKIMQPHRYGPAAIVFATALMAFQDALIKRLSTDLPLLLRSLLVIPLLAALVTKPGKANYRATLAPWVLIRSVLMVAMYISFYAALSMADLSTVAVVYYTGPLFIVLLSAFILRESITKMHITAMTIAFCGVLIVLQPAEGLSVTVFLPLLSALLYALAASVTRGGIASESIMVLILSLNLVFAAAGAGGIGLLWLIQPEPSSLFLLTA